MKREFQVGDRVRTINWEDDISDNVGEILLIHDHDTVKYGLVPCCVVRFVNRTNILSLHYAQDHLVLEKDWKGLIDWLRV